MTSARPAARHWHVHLHVSTCAENERARLIMRFCAGLAQRATATASHSRELVPGCQRLGGLVRPALVNFVHQKLWVYPYTDEYVGTASRLALLAGVAWRQVMLAWRQAMLAWCQAMQPSRDAALPALLTIGVFSPMAIGALLGYLKRADVHEIQGDVTTADAERYARDGVVVLRGAIQADVVDGVRAALESARAGSGLFSGKMGDHGGWTDKFLWRAVPAVRALALESPLVEAVAKLMNTRRTNLLYDHVCVKEPGDTAPTLWHHDINYLPVEPPDAFASAWLALDDVGVLQGRLEFVRGSHLWKNNDGTSCRFTPMDFPTMSAVTDDAWLHPEKPSRRGFEPLPDINACRSRYDVVSCDVRSGDVLVFHGLTLHYSAGNADPHRRRRGISLRYTGESARFTPRNKGIATGWPTPGPAALLRPGDPLTCDIWPLAYEAAESGLEASESGSASLAHARGETEGC